MKVFGTVKTPKVPFWTELVKDILEQGYPYMFAQGEQTAAEVSGLNYGRDLGGRLGRYILQEKIASVSQRKARYFVMKMNFQD